MRASRFIPVALAVAVSLYVVAVGASVASAAGDVNRAGCPNEANTGFTSALPDCRAYEQVSPVFENGFAMSFEFLPAGGESVYASSFAVLAGATGRHECVENPYDLVRSGEGWVTVPLGELSSELTWAGHACPVGLVNGEGEALLPLHSSTGSIYEMDLYVHRPQGAFTLVGPELPRSAIPPTPTGERQTGKLGPGAKSFVAATSNLEHTLFMLPPLPPNQLPKGIETDLWPGDTTLPTEAENLVSLYEYNGTGNSEPVLVGVENSGHLISDCGTSPGGDSGTGGVGPAGNHHNVISADGGTVFFTAVGADNQYCGLGPDRPPVEELFARLHGGQPQSPLNSEGDCTVPGDACTVAISEPQALAPVKNVGCTEACIENTSRANEDSDWRDANFEGASGDGSKVFFTSTQQLLDGAGQDPSTADSAHERQTEGEGGCRAEVAGVNGCNLYEYDFDNPIGQRLILISGGDTSGLGPAVQGVAALSEDGARIYFVAKGELTKAPNEDGQSALAGAENLYVNDTTTGQTSFIATLEKTDAGQWPSDGGGFGGKEHEPMSVTDDGRFLVFTSSAALTPGDTGTVAQVFRYDADTGALVRISVGEEGFNDDGNATVGEAEIHRAGSQLNYDTPRDLHPAVAEDGAFVVFESSVALTPHASNDKCVAGSQGPCERFAQNAYEYHEGHVYLLAADSEDSPAVSLSGQDIFFETTEPLVAQDDDVLKDIYDARVEGGFPAATTAPGCEGEGCQQTSAAPAPLGAPASATFTAPGNVASPPAPLITPKPKPRTSTRAKKLTNALRTCRKKRARTSRTSCEKSARRTYGPEPKDKKSNSDRSFGR